MSAALDEELVASVWENSLNAKVGLGHRDNVTFAHTNQQGADFVAAGIELMLWRLPVDDLDFYTFLTFDHWQYLGAETVEKEQIGIVHSQLKKGFGADWLGKLTLQYIYLDQIFDDSITGESRSTVRARLHGLELAPSMRYQINTLYWMELELAGSRQFYHEPLDDYWEFGPKLSLGSSLGEKSDLTLSYELRKRAYDNRGRLERDGSATPGSESLELYQNEIELSFRHYFDARKRWVSITRSGYRLNSDNGSGYFDYNRYQVGQTLRYRGSDWRVEAQVKWSRYDYRTQTVSGTDTSSRLKDVLLLSARAERRLSEKVKLYLENDYERSLSNLNLDDYTVNTVLGGIDCEF